MHAMNLNNQREAEDVVFWPTHVLTVTGCGSHTWSQGGVRGFAPFSSRQLRPVRKWTYCIIWISLGRIDVVSCNQIISVIRHWWFAPTVTSNRFFCLSNMIACVHSISTLLSQRYDITYILTCLLAYLLIYFAGRTCVAPPDYSRAPSTSDYEI